jgi:hypothetical protein
MFDLFETPSKKGITEQRNYEIEYYSEGKLLPNPFHKEYRMIANTVANSWIYEEQWQDLVNENLDAPIVEIDVKLPLPYTHSYTFKHVFLANSYLQDQKNYLENLS